MTDQTYLDALDRFKKDDLVTVACAGKFRRGLVKIVHSDTTCTILVEDSMLFRAPQELMTKIA